MHAFQFDMTSDRETGAMGAVTGAQRLPLWFIEGMAEYLSIGPLDPHTAMWMRDAIRQDRLPNLRQLNSPEYFPYRWGHAFWAYVAGRWGDDVVGELLRRAAATGSPGAAVETVLEVKAYELADAWHAAMRNAYQPVVEHTTAADASARLLLARTGVGGEINVGTALSPDGRWIAFLSERGLFSIDLFIADATKGTVMRQVTRTALDPHLSSLQFIASAGAWDGESRRLAYATLSAGKPRLVVFDNAAGKIERDIPLDSVDEVLTPTWAPDGRALAFTVYEEGQYRIYAVTEEDVLTGTAAASPIGAAAALPPIERADERVTRLLQDAALGLPDSAAFDMEPYRARLGLDYVGQPSIGISADRFGTYAGGALSFLFSDMLGNHNVASNPFVGGH